VVLRRRGCRDLRLLVLTREMLTLLLRVQSSLYVVSVELYHKYE
jgi:hypothetical protein